MNKKISFRLFVTVLWRGITQVFRSIAKLLGYKEGTSFSKIIWGIFSACFTILLAIITFIVLRVFFEEVVYNEWIRPHCTEIVYQETHLSNHIVVQDLYYHDKKRVYDENRNKVILKEVDWVITSDDKDSLAVFAQNDKRGYLNRFTGEVVLPPVYTKAWIFSEGLAAVEWDNRLVFIDHSGTIKIDNQLDVHFNSPQYVFHDGYCIIENPVDGKIGLIDKQGNWALQPEYDEIVQTNKLWKVSKGHLYGLYSGELENMFPVDNPDIYVGDSIIEVRFTDHTAKRFDYHGNVLVDFVIDRVENMHYPTTELSKPEAMDECSDGQVVYDVANCQKYMVRGGRYEEFYGLLSRDGKRITPPEYTSIDAIAEDLYLCQPHGIILNGRGVQVK